MTGLVARVSDRLSEAGCTLALAESCTGGLLSARLTDRAGASRFLLAGLVTYSNQAKQDLLGVPGEALATYGAVSEQVARAMVEGARARTGAHAALAITGIAGPGGGTAEKPVGTVWIGASLGDSTVTRRYTFDGGRDRIRAASVRAALELLEELLVTS
ncbi:MAG TPA: CinA family protein [Longimicrobiales bacterium]|nr:CinA family protein [Longimicrobiales bacterium]